MKGSGTFMRKIFIGAAIILLAVLYLQMPVWAKGKFKSKSLRVMTRNLYIGAEIQSIAAAGSFAEFLFLANEALVKVAETNFPERARALAKEIVRNKPHLVGLQEVYNITLNGINPPGVLPYVDYLDELLKALNEQGAHYYPAATVTNFSMDISFPSGDPTSSTIVNLGITDRDVILARRDVQTKVVDMVSTGVCPDRVSDDGCNYAYFAGTVIPGGDAAPDIPIEIKRGFVAVDAKHRSLSARFYNTHLEVRYPDPTNILSITIQAAQASELIQVIDFLEEVSPHKGPVILVGDINSSPEDEVIGEGMEDSFRIDPPYWQFSMAGYTDAWTVWNWKWEGFTCCQAEDLLNRRSELYERIDMVLLRDFPFKTVLAYRVGDRWWNKTPSGLWPSDHAGVVATMWYWPHKWWKKK
jgi:hypothetical protein